MSTTATRQQTPSSFARLNRATIEQILQRAAWLDEADRKLIEQVYEHGTSPTDLAKMTGQRPYRLHRRVRRLVRRLRRPLFVFVIQNHLQWPALRRDFGVRFFLKRESLATIARRSNVSLHRVRREIDAVRVLAEREGIETNDARG